jgi:alkaline phosphatase D
VPEVVEALRDPEVPGLKTDPFVLGVASGDPAPDSVVLWTMLRPEGGLDLDTVPIVWEVATGEDFEVLVATGLAEATAAMGHSVHANAANLAPGQRYVYRFRTGGFTSPVGRTGTAPPADAEPAPVRVGVASCQAYQTGYFTAYRQIAEADLDLVFFVGDYIYELEGSIEARPHGMAPPSTLEEFRAFYALNTTDQDLQAARAAHPWMVTWDDHEVEDNYADDQPGAIGLAIDPEAPASFAAKRAAAYQAWWEFMPVRTPPPVDGSLRIHRDLVWGGVATFAVVDNRQYRSPLATGEGAGNLPRLAGGGPQGPEAFAEDRSMLGSEQEAWLDELMRSNETDWFVLVQQQAMAQIDRAPDDPDRGFSMDGWDGYVANRNRILATVDEQRLAFVSLGGDIHTSAVGDLIADYHAPGSPVVGTEFVGTSISALELLPEGFAEAARTAPHIKLYDPDHRGWLQVTFTPEEARAEYRYVSTTATPDGEPVEGSKWVVDRGSPGVRPA